LRRYCTELPHNIFLCFLMVIALQLPKIFVKLAFVSSVDDFSFFSFSLWKYAHFQKISVFDLPDALESTRLTRVSQFLMLQVSKHMVNTFVKKKIRKFKKMNRCEQKHIIFLPSFHTIFHIFPLGFIAKSYFSNFNSEIFDF
jgi:hypothetical protein